MARLQRGVALQQALRVRVQGQGDTVKWVLAAIVVYVVWRIVNGDRAARGEPIYRGTVVTPTPINVRIGLVPSSNPGIVAGGGGQGS